MDRIRPRLYLAGPMAGLNFDEANQWRIDAHNRIGTYFECISPCRNKESLADAGPLTQLGYEDHFMCGEQTVFYRDTHDVRRCDGVLANFTGVERVSIGTPFELGMAWALGKPIVSVMEEDNVYDHIFTRQCSTVVTYSMEEAYQVLRSLFNVLG